MIFLLNYDRSTGVLVSEQAFDDLNIEAANEARLETELQFAENSQIEVVILKAQSREQLQETHARYFKTLKQLSPT